MSKEKKLGDLFNSCKMAFEELHEESNLIYLHLNPTHHLNQKITLYDRLHRRVEISADEFPFVLQMKGEMIFPYLTHLIDTDQKAVAKEALAQIALLINHRIEKGIHDEDSVIEKNSGFLNHKPFFLDIGNFSKMRSPHPHNELIKETAQLENWLQQHDPELATFFSTLLNQS